MKDLLYLLLFISFTTYSQSKNETGKSTIIAKKLLEIYPDEREGILDKKFASLVNKRKCLEIAKKIIEHWDKELVNFIKVMPNEYKRALDEMFTASNKEAA